MSRRYRSALRIAVTALIVGPLFATGLSGCSGGGVNQAAVSDQRLAGFKTPDELVMRGLRQPITVPKAEFETASGKLDFPKAFAGHWTLLYTGYTFCPDICPTELTQLSRLMPVLKKALPNVSWQVMFLSVDPARDSPKRMREYLNYFDPAFIGITGKRVMIDRVTGAVKAGYKIAPHPPGKPDYEVSHDTAFRLISPEGRMVAILPSPHHIKPMTRALKAFFKEVVE